MTLLTATKVPGSIPSSSSRSLSTVRPGLSFHCYHSPLLCLTTPQNDFQCALHSTGFLLSYYLLQGEPGLPYALESESWCTELQEAPRKPDCPCGYFYRRTSVTFRMPGFYLPTSVGDSAPCLSKCLAKSRCSMNVIFLRRILKGIKVCKSPCVLIMYTNQKTEVKTATVVIICHLIPIPLKQKSPSQLILAFFFFF